MGAKTKIVLRHLKIPEENREHFLGVECRENGDLCFDGWDITPLAQDIFDDVEYEYKLTIKKVDVPILRNVFSIPSERDTIEFLLENFSDDKSFDFEKLLKEKNVPIKLNVW